MSYLCIMKKICTKCNQELDINLFSRKGNYKDGSFKYQCVCKQCSKIYKDEHYKRNKTKYIEKIADYKKAQRDKNLIKLIEFFKLNPCVDCGENNPLVLEFDHLYDKKYTISKKLSAGLNWESLLKEINKCEVRCSNCHKIKTAYQYNWTILKFLNVPVV